VGTQQMAQGINPSVERLISKSFILANQGFFITKQVQCLGSYLGDYHALPLLDIPALLFKHKT
jgi:hypothetical protein